MAKFQTVQAVSVANFFASLTIRRAEGSPASTVCPAAMVSARAASRAVIASATLKLTPSKFRIFWPKALRRSE
jgi:hypothetical protein